MVCSSTPDYTWFEHINYTNELIFLTILRNLSRLWWQKKDTISKSLQQPFKRRRGDGYTQISCLSKGLNATWAYGVISSYSYLQKNIFPLWTHSSPQHDGGLLGVPVALSQQPEHSSASTGAWTWRCSQCGPNILSHEGDSQIPVTHLLQEFAEPSTISFSFFFFFFFWRERSCLWFWWRSLSWQHLYQGQSREQVPQWGTKDPDPEKSKQEVK